MAITFIDIEPEPQTVVRTANRAEAEGLVSCTRSELAPVDCRIANEELPKIPAELPKITENFGNIEIAKKRGRPRKADALTPAEKQRRYRERKRAAAS